MVDELGRGLMGPHHPREISVLIKGNENAVPEPRSGGGSTDVAMDVGGGAAALPTRIYGGKRGHEAFSWSTLWQPRNGHSTTKITLTSETDAGATRTQLHLLL